MSSIELTSVRDAHKFGEAVLSAYMQDHVEGFSGPIEVRQFEGGQSNPTFQLRTPNKTYVLRKQPPGELLKSAHQVDREYRVMHALRDTKVPVPTMYCLCEDKSILGTIFYIMDFVEGRVFTDPTMPDSNPEERRGVYLNLASILGELHSLRPEQVGLEEFGRPGNYYARQINRWGKQWLASKTEELPAMDKLLTWLPDNIPDDDQSGIVHGDYRLGNVLVSPNDPSISAVLDWELSTLGHPLGDLAYLCQAYAGVSSSGNPLPSNYQDFGVPAEKEMLDTYCAASGRGAIENWDFYVIFNMFRSASIIQGVYKRGLDGNASSELALGFKDTARQISDAGLQRLNAL